MLVEETQRVKDRLRETLGATCAIMGYAARRDVGCPSTLVEETQRVKDRLRETLGATCAIIAYAALQSMHAMLKSGFAIGP